MPAWPFDGAPDSTHGRNVYLGILSDKGFVSLLILNNCPLGKELYRETFLHEKE